MSEFRIGDKPRARTAETWRCPFCGDETAILSDFDLGNDPMRLEVYCNNRFCDVREMAVIALRAGGHEDERADVVALQTLDEGTPAERERFGYNRRMQSAREMAEFSEREMREGGRLRRRTRPTSITVHTHADWGEAHEARFEHG